MLYFYFMAYQCCSCHVDAVLLSGSLVLFWLSPLRRGWVSQALCSVNWRKYFKTQWTACDRTVLQLHIFWLKVLPICIFGLRLATYQNPSKFPGLAWFEMGTSRYVASSTTHGLVVHIPLHGVWKYADSIVYIHTCPFCLWEPFRFLQHFARNEHTLEWSISSLPFQPGWCPWNV